MPDQIEIDERSSRELHRGRDKLDRGIHPGPGIRVVNRRDGVTISADPVKMPPPEPPVIQRMRVTAAATSEYPDVFEAKFFNGDEEVGDAVPVKMLAPQAVGDEIIAFRPAGGTDETFGADAVVWEQLPSGVNAFRLKVTAVPGVNIVRCKLYDGTDVSGDEFAVMIHRPFKVDDEMLACQPIGGTSAMDGGNPVTWEEIHGQPTLPSTIQHLVNAPCGHWVDNLGRHIGWLDEDFVWQSPIGADEIPLP